MTLKVIKGVMVSPQLKKTIISLGLLLVAVVLFIVMLKLGFWQLSRAEEKQVWQQEITQRQQQLPLNITQLTQLINTQDTNLSGYRLNVTATPILQKLIMLDNQIYQGKVGYLVFQPLAVKGTESWILLELGFIEAGLSRNQLPQVLELINEQQFNGRVYQKQLNPFSHELNPEHGWPKRIQNLNIKQLENQLNHSLLNVVLQPEQALASNLPHPWQPIPMPAKKHQGYALQWFSLAGALLILMLIIICNERKKTTT